VDDAGQVHLGPLRFAPRRPVAPGPVRVAVRPEAWQVEAVPAASGAQGEAGALPGTLRKMAYLGSFLELTVDTPLGEVFVVSLGVDHAWQSGDVMRLRLGSHGVSVVAG
jgi:iron(III) transport system ATP-binding protein